MLHPTPKRRKSDEEPYVDPDDFWQAEAGLQIGTVSFTEYDQPDAADRRRETRPKADRVRFGFQPPALAYED